MSHNKEMAIRSLVDLGVRETWEDALATAIKDLTYVDFWNMITTTASELSPTYYGIAHNIYMWVPRYAIDWVPADYDLDNKGHVWYWKRNATGKKHKYVPLAERNACYVLYKNEYVPLPCFDSQMIDVLHCFVEDFANSFWHKHFPKLLDFIEKNPKWSPRRESKTSLSGQTRIFTLYLWYLARMNPYEFSSMIEIDGFQFHLIYVNSRYYTYWSMPQFRLFGEYIRIDTIDTSKLNTRKERLANVIRKKKPYEILESQNWSSRLDIPDKSILNSQKLIDLWLEYDWDEEVESDDSETEE